MPIRIPNDLPAVKTLEGENIFVMTETRAITQDIRPLKILLLNLMPKKIETETQLSRLLGNTPLQVELELIHTKSHRSKNTAPEHMLAFYKTFDDVKHLNFDGMIITGAPVEQMPFEDVEYWNELCEIMEWTKTHVHSTFHICWGAQAGLYYHFGIDKKPLDKKMFGIFPHKAEYKRSMLLRGFDDTFMVPHSRHTAIDEETVRNTKGLKVLASHINESNTNTTRFAVFSRAQKSPSAADDRFIMLFTVKNAAGSLGEAISVIGKHGFNLLALKSRPTKDLVWNYYFYVEGEGNIGSDEGKAMIKDLTDYMHMVH